MDKYKEYRNYIQTLRRSRGSFSCSECQKTIHPKDFEDHCDKSHNLDPKRDCVWCCGKYSWPINKKNEHVHHLMECFTKFISPTLVTPTLHSLEVLLCPEKSFFHHESDVILKLPRALDASIALLPVEWDPLPYASENLNLAVACVRKYLETRDTHDWLHVMVKAVAFESFVRALEEDDGGKTGLLPFSCWCDGGRYREAKHRQHRHMIAVAPKGHFRKKVWKNVSAVDRPCRNFPDKGTKEIVSARHLVNTLGYLSKRTSKCRFNLKGKKSPVRENHFYIFKSLPVNYKLYLVALWDGGVLELLKQEKFTNVSVSRLADTPVFRSGGQWKQRVKDFYALHRGLVLHVDEKFEPAEDGEVTPYFRHLASGRKLYFRLASASPAESLDRDAWLRKQADGGNSFYDVVGEETWTPRKRDQGRLNDLMPRVERIRGLEGQVRNLQRNNEILEEKMTRYKSKYLTLEKENRQIQKENRQMCKKLIKYKDTEIKGLKSKLLKYERLCTCIKM